MTGVTALEEGELFGVLKSSLFVEILLAWLGDNGGYSGKIPVMPDILFLSDIN